MGIKQLQDFLESQCSSACLSVDLLKISKGFVPKRRGNRFNGRFCLIVDAESCLDRLYGGYYSDWVCGGQWNRMLQFLSNLMQACHSSNLDLVVFFNGTMESQKLDEWYATQVEQKKKVNMALRHIYNKGTPPPKVWWNPPVFLTGTLRMALRHLGIGIACSMDDHAQEVIGFCREHGLQGILGHESVYAIFDPPRYFSSQHLKLTYRGSLETKEFVMDEVAKCLDLNPNRFCLFASLLGNHILSEDDLYEFYKERIAKASQEAGNQIKPSPENVIKAVVDYVRSLVDITNLDSIAEPVFKNSKGNKAELVTKLKQSVQYYRNGTQDGFLSYRTGPAQGFMPPNQHHLQQRPQDMSGYAHHEQGVPALMSVHVPSPYMNRGLDMNRHLKKGDVKPKGKGQETELPPVSPEVMRIASERHQKAQMSPWIYQVLSQGEIKMVVTLEDEASRELPTSIDLYRPIRQTVYSVLLNLNKMKIVHDTQNKDKVNASGAAPKNFEVPIKEWVVRRTGNQKPSFDLVIAKPVEWKAPSIERMWLGTQPDDKTRRLRAFLTCMHSDAQLMLNTNYVPQHLLVLCCVVRYMLQHGRILQSQELDAFLTMSVSPLLLDVQTMQDLKLPSINPRGVGLGALFMAGLENALFANEVCGSPIPWSMCCPWQFYDGKLFHFKLLKANNSTPLIDMCDGQVDQVMRVERMRQAVMEGLNVEFARPMLTQAMYAGYPMNPYPGAMFPFRPAGMRPMMPPNHPMAFMGGMGPDGPQKGLGRGRGILGLPKKQGRSPVDGRGGQLEIAGVVVGSWGPNLSASGRGVRGNPAMSPRVTSVGGGKRGAVHGMMYGGVGRQMGGRGGPPMPMYGMPPERMYYGRPTRGVVHGIRRPGVRARPNPAAKPKNKSTPAKGRGMTVDASGGKDVGREVVVSVKVGIDDDEDDDDKAIFEDADDGSSAIGGKVILQNGIQSPDDDGTAVDV